MHIMPAFAGRRVEASSFHRKPESHREATTKTTAHVIGVTRFELPLRGEAFAARSNDLAIGKPF